MDLVFRDLSFLNPYIPHPVALFGTGARGLERALNRGRYRKIKGVVFWLLLSSLAGLAGLGLLGLARLLTPLSEPAGLLLEGVVVGWMISARSLFDGVRNAERALRQDDRNLAKFYLSHLVGRDIRAFDATQIRGACLETLAENFSDGVVAPLFFWVLGGLPGLFFYKMVNTLDSMVGYPFEPYQAFGWGSARADDVANWLPARLSAFFLAAAGFFFPRTCGKKAFVTAWHSGPRHASPNAGWPEAALAGALDVRLGGPRHYGTYFKQAPWLGTGSAALTEATLRQAFRLYWAGVGLVCLFFSILLLGFQGSLIVF